MSHYELDTRESVESIVVRGETGDTGVRGQAASANLPSEGFGKLLRLPGSER
jgi:hypothetical protein